MLRIGSGKEAQCDVGGTGRRCCMGSLGVTPGIPRAGCCSLAMVAPVPAAAEGHPGSTWDTERRYRGEAAIQAWWCHAESPRGC